MLDTSDAGSGAADRKTIEARVRAYAAAWAARDREAWLDTFAESATQEDPIGSRVRQGRAEIGGFWDESMAPYLSQSNSYELGQPYTRLVENQGVGPARIRSFEVLVDGRPVRTWDAAVEALTGKADAGMVYTSFRRGSVLPPGADRTLVRIPPGTQAGLSWAGAQTRLETVICYCSIYEECWRAASRAREPVPVRACRQDAAAAFGEEGRPR